MVTKRSSIDQQAWWKKLKEHRYIRLFLFILFAVFTYALLVSNVIPQSLEIESGGVAPEDIRSPVTVENRAETERLQQEASNNVSPVYTVRPRFAENQIERINDIFQSVRVIQADVREQESLADQTDSNEEYSAEDQLAALNERLPMEAVDQLSETTLYTLLAASASDLEVAQDTATSAVFELMNEEISIDSVEEAKNQVEENVRITTTRYLLENAMVDVARYGITANFLFDEQATVEAREEAVEAVEPAVIREGQILVEEGQVITGEIYEQLTLVGLTEEVSPLYPLLGLALIIFLLVVMLAYYMNDAQTSLRSNNTHLLMYIIIYMITLVLLRLVSYLYALDIAGITYIAPVAVGTMLITILLQSRVAIFTSFIFSIAAAIMFNEQSTGMMDYSFGIFVFFSGLAGVFFLNKSTRMVNLLKTGALVSITSVLIAGALILLKNVPFGMIDIGLHIGFAAAGGLIAVILVSGILPFLEAGFGVLSTSRLIELSNPNNKLLRKILLEAPGTYHHSVVVANLAESACEAIGANGLLARVGAYYHDIGKTRRPQFFIENQMKMENPHDKLSPHLSKNIIIAHPYDGAEMLRQEKIPKELIDIAEQHHGTTLLKFFYYKAKENGDDVKEEEFRYPGPKARSKESAIVGVADSVEAAVRAMQQPTMEKIESLVKKIINDRLEDGQFDECDLTLRELHIASKSMCETLKGTFHSRIDYPDEEDIKKVKGLAK
ncbi:HD family phosphohydrolase [Paenalkalicoccus suaedae]|uniref:HD family phosphohydrolase n=1 Tax=Paenalkalicoccus suaedae TaxID=2592382 RepID=A0A859FD72_9BACI|nr:HD family phosphohydrolase [Paenalkalicoccus suaedae]QKS70860.1 HD family phosphohydrolase [Paenalkalicoccus suaedae]